MLQRLGAAAQGNESPNGQPMRVLAKNIAPDTRLGTEQGVRCPAPLQFDAAELHERVTGEVSNAPPLFAKPILPCGFLHIDAGEQIAIEQANRFANFLWRSTAHAGFKPAHVARHGRGR